MIRLVLNLLALGVPGRDLIRALAIEPGDLQRSGAPYNRSPTPSRGIRARTSGSHAGGRRCPRAHRHPCRQGVPHSVLTTFHGPPDARVASRKTLPFPTLLACPETATACLLCLRRPVSIRSAGGGPSRSPAGVSPAEPHSVRGPRRGAGPGGCPPAEPPLSGGCPMRNPPTLEPQGHPLSGGCPMRNPVGVSGNSDSMPVMPSPASEHPLRRGGPSRSPAGVSPAEPHSVRGPRRGAGPGGCPPAEPPLSGGCPMRNPPLSGGCPMRNPRFRRFPSTVPENDAFGPGGGVGPWPGTPTPQEDPSACPLRISPGTPTPQEDPSACPLRISLRIPCGFPLRISADFRGFPSDPMVFPRQRHPRTTFDASCINALASWCLGYVSEYR